MDDQELAQLKFLIIGKGAEEEVSYLKSLMNREAVAEAVCFTGYVEGDSQSIIEQLDLMLVLTVDFEGFGLTLAEAMSVDVPVLATKVGAIPEFIFHEKNGFLINPRNKDELIIGLRNFLSNQKEWKERAKVAKNSIQEFSIERLGREFCQLVNNL